MYIIILLAFLSGIVCQTPNNLKGVPVDQSLDGVVHKAIRNLFKGESLSIDDDQPLANKFQPMEGYLQSLRNNNRRIGDNAPIVDANFQPIEDYLQSLKNNDHPVDYNEQDKRKELGHNNVAELSTNTNDAGVTAVQKNNQAPALSIQKRKFPYSFLVGKDLHERHTLPDIKDAYTRLHTLHAAFLHARRINAFENPKILNTRSQYFLTNSVVPVLGCLKCHFNLDVDRFLNAQDNTLFYSHFKYKKCRGTPGKCTLLESMNKKNSNT